MEFCSGYFVYKKRVIEYFFLDLNQNMCCENSKETSHWDSSLEYPKHRFKLMGKNRSANFLFFLLYDLWSGL